MLFAFALLRLVFHLYNADLLTLPSAPGGLIKAYFWGLRYDLAVLVPSFLPVLILVLLNVFTINKQWLSALARLLMWVIGTILIVVSVGDIPYFRFNSRRATKEVFDILIDSSSAFSSFLIQFLLFVLLAFILMVFYGKVIGLYKRSREVKSIVPTLILLGLLFLGSSFGRPLTPKNITFHVRPEYSSLVSNTPLSLGYSFLKGQESLEVKEYFVDVSAQFKIHHALEADSAMQSRSVIIFVLESCSREYFVEGHPNKAPTPFLDSIMDKSIVFTNAFANGTTSAYGLMSILGGVPPFLDEPYFASIYGQNKIKGIGSQLREYGYTSSFFYGAEDDHYGFRKNMSLLGIDQYFSMEDYPGDAHDGNWGIYDGPFLQYASSVLMESPKPVFSTIFNISTHFPYMVPEVLGTTLPQGNLPSHQSLAYTDLALKDFFRSLEKDPELSNALFVFVADHWAKMREMEDKSAVGIYRIPFFIYDPLLPYGQEIGHVTQQVDVVPTILDHLDYSGPWMSFGTSALDDASYRFTYNEYENIYRIIDSTYVLAYDENRELAFSLHNYLADPGLRSNIIQENQEISLALENHLKAVIQTYNNSLITNDLWIKE
ncbi:MAG: sulfatase-like hydrolase/transferase [Bacteroidetes bacterium]|nr:sulfatase-like hydrolase/transferase [Bacteroidota bacterium]